MEYLAPIRGVFYNRLISTILILAVCIGAFFVIKFLKYSKWVFVVWAVVTVFISFFTIKGTVDLYCDIKYESYVVYCGEFINRGGSQGDLKTIVIYNDSGKEVKLLSGNIGLSTGEYTGEVVYGERSKIVSKITTTPLDDN